ncbi:chromosome segregation protein SMC [Candidatus Woesearchaeota archaeon]|nr:chromosome segregation protein SMC [Candidatus Woesearchaeota archaeon]
MTRINKIVMNGFKSFAKHTEMLFGPKFNVVLGPNGSGKSNILDALCFVLGKSSAKSMRAEKSSNLIYNGGKSKTPGKKGEVSIYFDNSNKKFPTDDEEVKVTRVVLQSGQSLYKINDKARTRQQILDLLNVAKINPDGYNIILQGDIVKFVEMSTVERRILIEEVAGISVYEEKKQKALNELEKVEGKLKEAEIILAERGTYLKELKKDRDQALKYKNMSDKVKQNKASLLKLQIDKKSSERDEFQKKIDSTNEELKKVQSKVDKFKQEIEDKKKQIEDITKTIEEKGEVEQVELNKQIENLKIGLTKSNGRVEVCRNEIKKISQRKEDLGNSIQDIDNRIEQLKSQKSELNEKRKSKLKERGKFDGNIKELRDRYKLDEAVDIDKKIEEIDQRADDLQKEIQKLREEQHNLIRTKDTIKYKLDTIDEKIKKVNEIEEAHKDQIEDLKKKREDFKSSTLELNKRLDEDTSIAAQLSGHKKELDSLNEDHAKLKARNAGIKEALLGDKAVKTILEKKNEISGIYGTVSELGNVSAKYALALEVAAGPRIKSIIVESDKVAAECIKYLKQNKYGTATFLPLNKIKSREAGSELKEIAGAKGCHGFALDLISFDAQFKKAFSYVFANTLVVDDIDVARRIGIGKAKMVTLDGDLAEFSGVMQGGYRKAKGVGFKGTELTDELNKAKGKIAEKDGVIAALENRREENEKTITELRNKKANLEGEIIKLEKSMHLEPADLEVSKQQKEELGKELQKAEDNVQAVQAKVGACNKELTDLKIEKQELRGKLSEFRDPALIAEISTFEEKMKEINQEILQLDADIKNADTQINEMLTPEKEKIENEILKQIEKEEEGFRNEIEGLSAMIKKESDLLLKKEQDAKQFYSKFKELFSKRSSINDEIKESETKINEQQTKSRGIEIRGNTLSIKRAEINSQVAGLQQEFQQYEGVEIDTTKTEEQLKSELSRFEKLRESIGSVNMRALEIYEDVEREYNSLVEKKGSLAKEKEDVEQMMQEIDAKKKELFLNTFDVVTQKFKEIFSALSTKGDALLELENKEDPFEAGLRVKVRITGNKFLDIRSLSGGEKTMTALAFIFAIQEHEPASFYVLDEVDAALDKRNSEKLAKLIGKYSDNAQYIMVSHNDNIIGEADLLYGISMNEHGISNIVSLRV